MSDNPILFTGFHGRTVLITGHTGFKGGWLALWLVSLGAKVIGYGLNPPTEPSFFQITRLSNHITDIRGDIRDFSLLSDTITRFRPDFIFHLAAQPLVRSSYQNPQYTFNVNVMGTVNVLESIRVSGISPVCVCITSDKCYMNKEWDYAYRENDPMGGYDPYSASKGAAEIVIAAYRTSFFNPSSTSIHPCLSSVRAGNIIGGGDWAEDRIVPDCVRALTKGNTIEIRNPAAVRPWQYVLEPLFGYLLLAAKMKEDPGYYSESWNFGPDYSGTVDVESLVKKILHVWGSGNWNNVSQAAETPHEAKYLRLDITKSVTKLGWKPIYTIDEVVQKTMQWYKECYMNDKDMYHLSVGEIEEYMRDINYLLR